ncbi:MAG: succinylglutamate desuccinylase/aspartoacylase family protein [Verrucomicrobiales bacterium]|jgi:protein MpaA|nr:succinylglutamate desuccinylase/aspartoacylase family protein [Verrucomicrobiales bacterium]MBP9223133.1 succinylglutamate desuccinylase/aspartoacylase family protein [Verrucomicrobiales bacterium]HQZ28027.1 succinylglutamate desuccinylase/aspartoacylase family protein [Verrucomicrobiales bacterium]
MRNSLTSYEEEFSRVASCQGFDAEVIWESGEDCIRFWTRSAACNFGPRIFLSAGIHGDEPCGPEALLRLLKLHSLSHSCDWVIAPVLNPTGIRAGTRENRNGIDLNRDFYRKESGEIRAFTRWWEEQRQGIHLHISLHEDWETSGLYLYEINTGTVTSFAGMILESIRDSVPLEEEGPVDGHELSAPGLILHEPEPDEGFGWPEAIWLVKRYPLLSLTLEGPGGIAPDDRTTGLLTALRSAVAQVETMAGDASCWSPL